MTTTASNQKDIQTALSTLEAFPERFRVLNGFDVNSIKIDKAPDGSSFFIVADTETTGIDTNLDGIVEMGLVKVAYNPDTLEVYGAIEHFEAFDDPGIPISPQASAINNITDDMVKGHKISDEEVKAILKGCDFVLCHNSNFDRPLLERRFPFFQDFAFACSLREIDWTAIGIGGAKLDYIAFRLGFFFEGHRAATDCFALANILKQDIPELPGMSFLELMLQKTNTESRRIWAVNAPFAAKDDLKARGYRWSDGANPDTEKAWWTEVPLESFDDEIKWLKSVIYANKSVAIPIDAITAKSRYSSRRVSLGLHHL